MASLIILPNGDTGIADMTPIPAGSDHNRTVREYPTPDEDNTELQYASLGGDSAEDAWEGQVLPTELALSINSVEVLMRGFSSSLPAGATIDPSVWIGAVRYGGGANVLTVDFEDYRTLLRWNPATRLVWTLVALNQSDFGARFVIGAAAATMHLTQGHIIADVSPIGAIVSDLMTQASDTIQISEPFSILLQGPNDVPPTSTVTIIRRNIDASETIMPAVVLNTSQIFATMGANANDTLGKLFFKYSIDYPTGETQEGDYLPVVVRRRWAT